MVVFIALVPQPSPSLLGVKTPPLHPFGKRNHERKRGRTIHNS